MSCPNTFVIGSSIHQLGDFPKRRNASKKEKLFYNIQNLSTPILILYLLLFLLCEYESGIWDAAKQ